MSSSNKFEVITIDGPAGSGKSTAARLTAEHLSWNYIDTGAMYRCLCLFALNNDLETTDTGDLVNAVKSMDFEMVFDNGKLSVYMNGTDVTDTIRAERVSTRVSEFSALSAVRDEMVQRQRCLARQGRSVVEGRDIGTVVFPDAKHKFYLDAPLEVRARRRYTQLKNSVNNEIEFESVVEEIQQRDRLDRDRSTGPLKPPGDATVISTEELTVHGVVDQIIRTLESHE